MALDYNLLGIGGIVAAVTAGWSYVKTTFSYLSSLLIANIDLNYDLGTAVLAYLKKEYKTIPTGWKRFQYINRVLYGKNHHSIVPYRTLIKPSIFYKSGIVLFCSSSSSNKDTLNIRCLRWSINPEKLVKAALEMKERIIESSEGNNEEQVDRFVIVSMKGNVTAFAAIDAPSPKHGGKVKRAKSDHNELMNLESEIGNSSGALFDFIDPNVDESFMYTREQIIWQTKDNPFDDLYYPERIQVFIRQAIQWFKLGKWYLDRKLPWRRGWLLFGPPGTGKTSLAKAVARIFKIPLYTFHLSTYSDSELIDDWATLATPCVVLFEDFDTIFHGRENITNNKMLTFDCVLNLISGVNTSDGVFLVVTTNDLSKIDPAIGNFKDNATKVSTRPGRIDCVIEISFMEEPERRKMAEKILRDWPEEIDAIMVQELKEVTPTQFQEMCIQKAFLRLEEKFKEKTT